jgi:hypothetical protein
LTIAAVDAVELLELPGLAVGIAVIAQRTAAMTQGAAKHALDGAAQTANLPGRQLVRPDAWVDARGEEGFVGVDIS